MSFAVFQPQSPLRYFIIFGVRTDPSYSRDAQRLEVFYNRNQQLKEQNKSLQDTIGGLEERYISLTMHTLKNYMRNFNQIVFFFLDSRLASAENVLF